MSTRDGASYEQDVSICIGLDDLEVADGPSGVAHVTGHAHPFDHMAR